MRMSRLAILAGLIGVVAVLAVTLERGSDKRRALVITGPDFRSLLRRVPEIQVNVLEALAQRLAPEAL